MTHEDIAILRIVDANLNRASEGLRVAEEHARFVLDDPHLTSIAKSLRHDLADVARVFNDTERLASRNALQDVGLEVSTDSEFQRQTTTDIGVAAVKRAQQALRCLEEYGKLVCVDIAAKCERIRYATYTLERTLHTTAESQTSFQDRHLYVLIDCRASDEAFEALVLSLVAAGVDLLQLRDKQATDRELLSRATLLRKCTRETKTLAIINDRPDIARLVNADGVHVGQDELPIHEVRKIVSPNMLVGISTHSIDQARAAVVAGASYLGCGPTFPSGTKQFDDFPGLSFLRSVTAEIRLPAFAIGGIGSDNIERVTGTGFSRVAVSGAVLGADDPAHAASTLRQHLVAASRSA